MPYILGKGTCDFCGDEIDHLEPAEVRVTGPYIHNYTLESDEVLCSWEPVGTYCPDCLSMLLQSVVQFICGKEMFEDDDAIIEHEKKLIDSMC